MLRNLLPLTLLLATTTVALAQGTPARPLLAPPPTTGQTGELQGKSTKTTDPTQTVTLDTSEVKLRLDPTKPLPGKAPARPAPKAKAKPRQ